jgi:hypothetical protein
MLITKKKPTQISPETEALMATAGVSLVTDLAFTSSPTSVMISSAVGLALAAGMYPKESSRIFTWFQGIYRRFRWSGFVLASGMALYLVNFLAFPAQAQFLNQTQSWMTSVFPQAQAIAPLIFNAIRIILVLFIVFQGFKAVQAARNDEEWQSLVKIPLIIIVLVAITDVTVGFITGSGGGGGTP